MTANDIFQVIRTDNGLKFVPGDIVSTDNGERYNTVVMTNRRFSLSVVEWKLRKFMEWEKSPEKNKVSLTTVCG